MEKMQIKAKNHLIEDYCFCIIDLHILSIEGITLKKLLALILAVMVFCSTVTAASAEKVTTDTAPEKTEAQTVDNGTENTQPTIETTEAPTVVETIAPTEQEEEKYPVIKAIETADGGLKISWAEYEGAYRYRLFIKRDDSSGWKALVTTSLCSYTHTNLVNNKEYIYTVRAVDENGAFSSAYNKDGWVFTYLESPAIKTVSSVNDGLKVSWEKVEGAENYKVYVRQSNGWKALGYTTTTSFIDTQVKSGNSYRYTVRCVSADGKAFTSYCNTKGVSGTYVETPQITKVENVATGAKVSWEKVDGATKYRLFYKLSDGKGWKTIGNTSDNSYTHSPLKNGDTYTYTVRALDSNNSYISSYNSTGTKNTFLSVPVITSVSSAQDGLEIKWNKVEGAVNYRVYVKTTASWKALGNTTSTSFVDKTAKSGVKYTYTVRCVSADGKTHTSYFDTKGMSGSFIETPLIKKVENLENGVKVTWNKVGGVSKYKLFYKLSDGSGWKTIGTTTADNFTHKNIKDGDTYIYTVRGCNSNGAYISGYDKTGVKNTFIAPITISSIKCDNGEMVLSWEGNEFASGYRIYRKVFTGSWSRIADVNGYEYIDASFPKNAPYTYTIRCLNENSQTISYHTNDTKYYYNGELANGKIAYNGSTYNFANGLLKQGYVTINGKMYYYNNDGVMLKNCIVGNDKDGYCYATSSGVIDFTVRKAVSQNGVDWNVLNGKAYKVNTQEDRTLFRAFKEVDKALKGKDADSLTKSQKLKICFDYVKGAYIEKNPRIPHYNGMDWPVVYANDMFVNGVGNCLSYGAAFAYMAKAIGYEEVYCCHSGGHGWAEIDGLVYDPEWSRHHFTYSYYALSYDTKTDQNYKGAIAPGYAWMHIKI